MKSTILLFIALTIGLQSPIYAWDEEDDEIFRQMEIQSKYPRESGGKRYKYDMLNAHDRARYETDLNTQMREKRDMTDELRRRSDPWGGRFRGPSDWD